MVPQAALGFADFLTGQGKDILLKWVVVVMKP